jgi:arylsulfotransferase ASST
MARGHVLVTPRSHPERRRTDQHGVMILSSRGDLLWYSARPSVARDLKTVTYRGRRMLALHQAASDRPAHYELLDRRYQTVARIQTRYGYRTNLHELQLTSRGTAYVSAYQAVRHPALKRPVTDYVIQEIDIPTRDVLFEWHALDHVPPSASYQTRPRRRYSWDYFHGNSIEPPDASGTIIVSARNTSAIYGIDRATGALRWTFGGKRDDFRLVRRHRFCAQHDARRAPGGDLLVFDDGGLALGNMRDCAIHRARVQRFDLDPRRRRARLVRSIGSGPASDHGRGLWVWAAGSSRRQSNGNVLIDWGTTGRVTEVTRRGEIVYGLQLESYSYRAVRSMWRGTPTGSPVIVAARDGSVTRIWASWNGATEIARWRVLAGSSAHTLARSRASRRFTGLETLIRARIRARYVAIEALDADGEVLGRSPSVAVR